MKMPRAASNHNRNAAHPAEAADAAEQCLSASQATCTGKTKGARVLSLCNAVCVIGRKMTSRDSPTDRHPRLDGPQASRKGHSISCPAVSELAAARPLPDDGLALSPHAPIRAVPHLKSHRPPAPWPSASSLGPFGGSVAAGTMRRRVTIAPSVRSRSRFRSVMRSSSPSSS